MTLAITMEKPSRRQTIQKMEIYVPTYPAQILLFYMHVLHQIQYAGHFHENVQAKTLQLLAPTKYPVTTMGTQIGVVILSTIVAPSHMAK
jgi:hypothetical protein